MLFHLCNLKNRRELSGSAVLLVGAEKEMQLSLAKKRAKRRPFPSSKQPKN